MTGSLVVVAFVRIQAVSAFGEHVVTTAGRAYIFRLK